MPLENVSFFDPWQHIETHGSKLPHWQQPGATFFVTFRLADSIPANLLSRWKNERENWILQHPEPWTTEIEKEYHRRFSTRIDQWLDQGHGDCVLRKASLRREVSNILESMDGVRYYLHSWIIMPNHAHTLFTLADEEKLEPTIKSWKGISARKINSARGKTGTNLWMEGYFDRMIRDTQHFFNVARYVRRNPEKANLCSDEFELFESEFIQETLSS